MSVATSLHPASARRDYWTIGSVGSAHFISHFLQLALAPLLPLMRAEFGVSYTELAFVLTLFYATSGLGQVMAGILVDRFGAHRLLLAGILLQSGSVLLMGFAPSYAMLFPLAVGAGLGNTVYHPADLSILSKRVSLARQGRGFATHAMTGFLGFGASPVVVGAVALHYDWRTALIGAGLLGLIVGLALLANRRYLRTDEVLAEAVHHSERDRPAEAMSFFRILILPVVLAGFLFFLLSAFAGAGVMSFTVAAFTLGYGVSLTGATYAVALYQIAAIGGTLAGGWIADRFGRLHLTAVLGMIAAAGFTLVAAFPSWPTWLVVAGLTLSGVATGVTLPSRDLLIRRNAPPGNLGKTFGTVYSGLDAGSFLAPLVFGPVLDHNMPGLLFGVCALALFVSTFTVMGIRSRPSR